MAVRVAEVLSLSKKSILQSQDIQEALSLVWYSELH